MRKNYKLHAFRDKKRKHQPNAKQNAEAKEEDENGHKSKGAVPGK